ncbi:PhoH family protein [Pontiella sp.]|uniref:PhoH family protein n=1 Tax=Pontiella sp. TaxID=2837462 RepID=UPI00356A7AF7
MPSNKKSGLLEARTILGNIQGLELCELSERDVVRHPLVQKVIEAYQATRTS